MVRLSLLLLVSRLAVVLKEQFMVTLHDLWGLVVFSYLSLNWRLPDCDSHVASARYFCLTHAPSCVYVYSYVYRRVGRRCAYPPSVSNARCIDFVNCWSFAGTLSTTTSFAGLCLCPGALHAIMRLCKFSSVPVGCRRCVGWHCVFSCNRRDIHLPWQDWCSPHRNSAHIACCSIGGTLCQEIHG